MYVCACMCVVAAAAFFPGNPPPEDWLKPGSSAALQFACKLRESKRSHAVRLCACVRVCTAVRASPRRDKPGLLMRLGEMLVRSMC